MSVATLIVLFVVVVALVNAGPVAILLHQDADEVTGPDGRTYRVQVHPTGFPWVSWFRFDHRWWATEWLWLRQLHHPRGTWTVAVMEPHAGPDAQTVLTEECLSWKTAHAQFWDAVEGVKLGRIPEDRLGH